MYKSHIFSKTPMKVKEYKQYSNLLNKMKAKAKEKYYNQCFQLHKENPKETWKLIGAIIKRKAGAIIGDGDRKSWDPCRPMIWDNFSIFRTNAPS